MKQRLLLFMFVLSLALSAKAYTVTFDVKFGSFMTNKQWLEIGLSSGVEGEYRSYYSQYDEATGKYTVNEVPSGKYTVYAKYPSMFMYNSIENVDINADKTVPLDFTGYHKATFKAPDGFKISDVFYYFIEGGAQSLNGSSLYLQDGTYQWSGQLKRISDNMVYGANKQSFTMNGADRDVVYVINNNDYHKVTFGAKGVDNQPVAISYVELNGRGNDAVECYLNSDNLSCMLTSGKYSYSVSSDRSTQKGIYQNYHGYFEVSATDVKVEIPYNKCKKLSVEVLGNNNIDRIDFSMRSTIGYNDDTSYSLSKDGNTYSEEFYYMPGAYDYRLNLYSDNGNLLMPEAGRITLTEDNVLKIDLSHNYYPVNFVVVDGQGAQLQQLDWRVNVVDENGGNRGYGYQMDKPLYMHKGDYRAECRLSVGHEDVTLYQNFNVDNAGKTVTFVYDETQYHEVKISSKAPASDEVKLHLFADSGVNFYTNGYRCGHAAIDRNNGTASVTLAKGTYTYCADSDYGMPPLYGTITVTGKDDKLELDFSQYGIVYAKAEDYESREISFTVSQGNKALATGWSDYSNAILLLPTGTYNVLAVDDYDGRQCKKTVTVTAGGAVHENFSLIPRNSGKYLIAFSMYDSVTDSPLNKYTVTLNGYGECEVLGGGYGFFSNVSAAENLGYTITSPGYIPFSSTVNVNEENGVNGMIEITVIMNKYLTSIDGVTADAKMAVYPTTPRNYIYIHPEAESVGTWNVRLASVTGAVVYNNRMQIDGETPLYVGSLPKGLYLLTLNNGEQRMTFKIFKK